MAVLENESNSEEVTAVGNAADLEAVSLSEESQTLEFSVAGFNIVFVDRCKMMIDKIN